MQLPSTYAPFSMNPGLQHQQFQQFTGFEGMPSTGSGSVDAIAQMLLQMFGGQFMGQYGLTPMGLSDTNLLDRFERLRMQQMHDDMVAQMAQLDAAGYVQSARGLAALSGTPWGTPQINAANNLAQNLVQFTPLLTQVAPNLLDELSGGRGSAAVMADYMFRGSRYRLDPVTGDAGMTSDSAKAMAEGVFGTMFAEDNWRRSAGLPAGQSGILFEQLARLGALPRRPRLTDLNQDVLTTAARDAGFLREGERLDLDSLNSDQVETLRSNPQVQGALRTFDASRVSQSLEEYGRVLNAMREIFGDAGHPNAPIPELINALNALSGGAMPQLAPHELETMVRTTYNLSRNAGVGLEGLQVLTQAAQVQAMQYGLPPMMATALTQESLAFRGAYMHQGFGAYQAWGRGNIDEMMALNQQLTANTQDSPMANRIGMALRLEDTLRAGGGPAFRAGSEAEAYMRAIRGQSTEYVDPNTGEVRSVLMGESEFIKMFSRDATADVSPLQLYELLEDKRNNMREFHRNGSTALVRRLAAEEMRGALSSEIRNNMQSTFELQGLSREDARALAGVATATGMNAFGDADVYTDDKNRSRIIGRRIRESVQSRADAGGPGAEAARRMLEKHGPDSGFWSLLASQQYSEVEYLGRNNPWGIDASAQQFLDLQNPELLAQASREVAREQATAWYQEALAPLNRGGTSFLRRGITALQNADEDSSLTSIFLESVGGVRRDDLKRALTGTDQDRARTEGVLGRVRDAQQAFETSRREYENAMAAAAPEDPAERAAWMRRREQARLDLEAKREGLNEATRGVLNHLGNQGFYVAENLSGDDVKRIMRERLWVTEQLGERTSDAETFRRGVSIERQGTGDLVTRALSDPQLLMRMGEEGRGQVRELQATTRQLDALASKYAGGDLSKLLSGDYTLEMQDSERRRLGKQVESLRGRQSSLIDSVYGYVEGDVKYAFLTEDEDRRLRALSRDFAEDPTLRREHGLEIDTMKDVLSMTDEDFAEFKSSTAFTDLSEKDRNLVISSRERYKKESDRVDEYRKDMEADSYQVLEQSLERLHGRDLSREEIAGIVGGEEELNRITSDRSIRGRRRIAGLGQISRDLARIRTLEGKKKLTKEEQSELARLKRHAENYDPYWRNSMDAEGALAPDAGSFADALEGIPSVGPTAVDGTSDAQASPVKMELHVTELYLDGEPQGAAEGGGEGEVVQQRNRDM